MVMRRRKRGEEFDDEPDDSSWDDPQEDDDPQDDDDDEDDDSPGDEDDEDDEDQSSDSDFEPSGPTPRRQRRAERGRMREENERMRAEMEDLKRQNAMVQGALSQFTQAQQQRYGQPPPQEDPYDREIARVDQQMEAVADQFGTLKEGEHEKLASLRKQLRTLETEKFTAIAGKQQRALQGQQQQQNPEQIANYVLRKQLENEHPDIYGDNQRRMVAGGIFERLLLEGKNANKETHDLAMEEARRTLGLKTRTDSRTPPRSRGARTRMSGQGRGAAGAQGGSLGSIKRTPELQRLADVYAPDEGSAKKRFQKWVNGPGRRMLSDMKSGD